MHLGPVLSLVGQPLLLARGMTFLNPIHTERSGMEEDGGLGSSLTSDMSQEHFLFLSHSSLAHLGNTAWGLLACREDGGALAL